MTTVHAPPGGVVVLALEDAEGFANRCPDLYVGLLEGVAFVNWRRMEAGGDAVLTIAFYHGSKQS